MAAQRLVAEIAPGEIVGEIGMLAGGPRSASIRAVRDSLLLRMDAAAFDQLGPQRPGTHPSHRGRHRRPASGPHGGPAARRQFAAVAVLPLDDGAATASPVRRARERTVRPRGPVPNPLVAAHGGNWVPRLAANRPGAGRFPADSWTGSRTEEDRHRFVLYVADAGETPGPISPCATRT